MSNKEKRVYNGLIRGAKILAFGVTLVLFCLVGLLWFARPETSVLEKRTLTAFPSFTWDTFWSGEYFSQVSTWYADTYPTREHLISMSQRLQSHYGLRGEQLVGGGNMVADEIPDPVESMAPTPTPDPTPSPSPTPEPLEDGTVKDLGELQGSIYITDNAGYQLFYFTREGTDAFADAMNRFYKNVGDKVNIYTVIAPTNSGAMLDQAVLDDMGTSDEKAALDYLHSRLDPGIHAVSCIDSLRAHNAEYVYFHTDHHWTALGAYYAYRDFCAEKGIEPHDIKDYTDTITFENFVGTLYSYSGQAPELAANPDTVTAYYPKGTNDMQMTMADGNTYDWNIIYDVSDYPNSEYYGTFVGGDNPFSVAHNPTITDGSAVCVIKDSYGNAFIPWLVDHYEYIYWIDVRYTENTISQMVKDYGIQDVILAINIYNGTTDTITGYLDYIGQ